MLRVGFAAVGAILIAGCGTSIRTTLLGEPRPADPDAREILVYSADRPRCPFDEIALVSARRREGVAGDDEMREMLGKLKEHARRLGGHAIVGLTERPETKEESPSLSGTVVRFRDPGCRENGGG